MKNKNKKTKKVVKKVKKIKSLNSAKKATRTKLSTKKSKGYRNAFFDPMKISRDIKRLAMEQRRKLVFSEIKDMLRDQFSEVFNFGKMTSHQSKVAVLMAAIIFAGAIGAVKSYYHIKETTPKNFVYTPSAEEIAKKELRNKISTVVKGHPIEQMIPYIAEKDKMTAAFLIGIAKKESNWGKRRPVLAGEDCFNYWGFRQSRERMGSGGHTCFDSPQDAVDTVAKRVSQIIEDNDAESAKNMIVWKCGYSCETHSDESVRKWISDVDFYADKILN